MTELNKPVKREFRSSGRLFRRPIIIQLDPDGYVRLKEKGGHSWYSISLEALYCLLIKDSIKEVNDKKRKTKRPVGLKDVYPYKRGRNGDGETAPSKGY